MNGTLFDAGHQVLDSYTFSLQSYSQSVYFNVAESRDFFGGSGSRTASFEVMAPASGHTNGQRIFSIRLTKSEPDKK